MARISVKFIKQIYLFVIMLIITFSGAEYTIRKGWQSKLEYIGYGLLFIAIFYTYQKLTLEYRKKYLKIPFQTVFCLFSVGILLQKLSWKTKIILLFTMLAILFSAFLAENLIENWGELRAISYGISLGVLISAIFAVASGIKIITTSEGIFGFTLGFNGGIRYKNYFAADMLAVFIGLYLYEKSNAKKNRVDSFVKFLSIFFLLISGSRGAYVMFIIFIVAFRYEDIKKIRKRQRNLFLFFLILFLSIAFIFLYFNVAMKSSTYMYRVRGLINYIEYYMEDKFHMAFGNAEMAYEQKLPYVMAIRSVVGWDGSLEFAWLDIIIKNGILGVAGYAIIFIRCIKTAFKTKNWFLKTSCIAVSLTCLSSSLVETYIQNVHAVYGIFSYLVMAMLCGYIHKRDIFKLLCIEEYR